MPKNTKFIALRKKAGFETRYSLSKASGVSEAHLRQIEEGTIRSLQFSTAARLAQALKLDVDSLGAVVPIKDQAFMMNFLTFGSVKPDGEE